MVVILSNITVASKDNQNNCCRAWYFIVYHACIYHVVIQCLFVCFFAEGSYYLRGARNFMAKAMVWPVSQHMDCDLL